MKSSLLLIGLLLVSVNSMARHGVDSSGGVNQVLENCQSENGDSSLIIQVVNNDHLEVQFIDSSDLNSTNVYNEEVHGVTDGYSGKSIKIAMDYFNGGSVATVMIESTDLTAEPLVYSNLKCSSSLK